MRRFSIRRRLLGLALSYAAFSAPLRADGALHALWELHGKHNTVYLLGSIHVLRPSDYPLAPAMMKGYADAKAPLSEVDSVKMQTDLLASARLPEGKTLQGILGDQRYRRAQSLAQEIGVDLGIFDAFAP